MPILLLHDLPGGIDLEAGLMRELGDHAPIIGFDMFGNGNSTLAARTPLSVEIWVEQACDVLDALGLKQVLVYAAGTSALVAVELARARPDAVRGVVFRSPPVIDCVSLCDQSEDYAPNISPARDGGNFLRLWHHLRDQELWYPWHTPTTACAKSTRPRIDPDERHRRAVILLKQPEQYREIWRTVINYPLADELSHMRVPSRVVSHEQDTFAFAAERAAHISAGAIPSKVKADASLAAVLNSAFVMLQ
ncbi:MAG: alpha/beta hydrolase, partial [Terricaulis sp.]